jgi:hypothetical protein
MVSRRPLPAREPRQDGGGQRLGITPDAADCRGALAPAPARILIAAAFDEDALPLVTALQGDHELAAIVSQADVAHGLLRTLPGGGSPDVVVVSLSRDVRPLCWALELRAALGEPEVVVTTRDPSGPLALALNAVGITQLLACDGVAAWLREAIPALAATARARRAVALAKASRPGPPADGVVAATLPLFEAEGRFREAYLRALLALSGSRRAAAERARVPYRTFCKMLEKAGVQPAREREAPPGPNGVSR